MYAEVAWVLVSLGTQAKPQIIPDPDYLSDYLSVSYDYALADILFYIQFDFSLHQRNTIRKYML